MQESQTHTVPITHCMNVRCGNELTFEEYKRQAVHCTPCERKHADQLLREKFVGKRA